MQRYVVALTQILNSLEKIVFCCKHATVLWAGFYKGCSKCHTEVTEVEKGKKIQQNRILSSWFDSLKRLSGPLSFGLFRALSAPQLCYVF